MIAFRYSTILLLLVLGSRIASAEDSSGSIASADNETAKVILAAQIRSQGISCDKPKQAVRDAKRSKPDYDVWTLTCENATYRVSRYPDRAAKVEQLR